MGISGFSLFVVVLKNPLFNISKLIREKKLNHVLKGKMLALDLQRSANSIDLRP